MSADEWNSLISSNDFRTLPRDQKEARRVSFFDEKIAPTVAPEKLPSYRAAWDRRTLPQQQGRQAGLTPAPGKQDGAFAYSVDRSQQMLGRGIQSTGDLIGSDRISQFGKRMVEQQEKDIAEGGYQPKHPGSFTETIQNEGVKKVPSWLGEKLAENWATTGMSLAGGIAAALTAKVSVPAALLIGLGTTGAMYLQGTGESALEMEESGGDVDDRIAGLVGVGITALDRLGLGKVLPKAKLTELYKNLDKMTGDQLVAELRGAGAREAADQVQGMILQGANAARRSAGQKAVRGFGWEAATEAAQESLIMGGAAATGGTYTPREVVDTLIDSAIIGGSMGAIASPMGGSYTPEQERARLLQDPNASPAQRLQAAKVYAAEMQSDNPVLAGAFMNHATKRVMNKQPFLDEGESFYDAVRPLDRHKFDTEIEAKQQEILALPAPQDMTHAPITVPPINASQVEGAGAFFGGGFEAQAPMSLRAEDMTAPNAMQFVRATKDRLEAAEAAGDQQAVQRAGFELWAGLRAIESILAGNAEKARAELEKRHQEYMQRFKESAKTPTPLPAPDTEGRHVVAGPDGSARFETQQEVEARAQRDVEAAEQFRQRAAEAPLGLPAPEGVDERGFRVTPDGEVIRETVQDIEAREAGGELAATPEAEAGRRPSSEADFDTQADLMVTDGARPEAVQARTEIDDAANEAAGAQPKASSKPRILRVSRQKYLQGEIKKAKLQKDSPGYAAAVASIEAKYEDDLDRAHGDLTFEEFNALNKDSPEGVNRQAWEQIREDMAIRRSVPLSGENPSDSSPTGLQARALLARHWNGNPEESVAAAIHEAKAINASPDVIDWINTNQDRLIPGGDLSFSRPGDGDTVDGQRRGNAYVVDQETVRDATEEEKSFYETSLARAVRGFGERRGGIDSGVAETGGLSAVTGLDQIMRAVRNRVKEYFGRDVIFYQSDDPFYGAGFYDPAQPDSVFININGGVRLFRVAGHELLHALKQNTPDAYSDLISATRGLLQGESKYRERLGKEYDAIGVEKPSEALAQEELMAEVAERFFQEKQFWSDLERYSEPSAFRRFMKAVSRWLNELRGKIDTGSKDPFIQEFVQDIDGTRKAMAKAFAEFAKKKGITIKGDNEIKMATSASGMTGRVRETAARVVGRPRPDPNDPFAAENARLREQDKTIWSKAKKLLRRAFAPGGLLPSDVFDEKILRDSNFQAVEFDIRNLNASLERAIKDDFGVRADKLTEHQMRTLGEALAGRVSDSIPEATRAALVAMRQYIDALSGEYLGIMQGRIDDLIAQANDTGKDSDKAAALREIEMYEKIKGNIGAYVHRSYRAFDDPKWFQKVSNRELNAARRYLAKGYVEQGESEAEARRLAEVTLNEILKNGTAYDSMESFITEGKLGAKDLSVLMRRKEVPPEIRALLGEYTDPRMNFTKSATKMGRLIWNQRFLDRVRDIGVGSFLFEGKNRPAEATTQIATDGSSAMAPLNGMWTYPEIAQAFEDALGAEKMGDLYRTIVRMNGMVKVGKTVLSPTTAMRNWQSALFFTLANGHFDLTKMKHSVSAFREQVLQTASGDELAYLRHLKELGVVYDTPYAGELRRYIEDSKLEDLLEGKTGSTAHFLRRLNQMAQGFYTFGDDFWKIIGFENEKANLLGAGFSESQAESMAAERIRNTYPTYSMVGKSIKWLSRFPLVGTFVSFPAEIVRTTANMMQLTASDLKSDNPGLRAIGRKRAAGMAMVSAGFYALSAMTAAMLGVDDEEEEALRDLAAPWQKNSTFLYTGRDAKGNLRYFDLSFLDPYGYWKRPLTAMMRDQPWQDAAASALRDMLDPFFGTDIATGAIFEVLANKKGSGGRVYSPNGDVVDQTLDIATHLRRALQPGFMGNAERLLLASQGVRREGSGQPYDMRDEVVALLGWRASTFDAKTALYYRSFEFTDALSDARKVMNRTLRSSNKVSDSDIHRARETAQRQYKQAFKEMERLVKSARAAGMSSQQIMEVLRLSGVSGDNVMSLLAGRTPPMNAGMQGLDRAVNQARIMQGAEHAQEVARRYGVAREGVSMP